MVFRPEWGCFRLLHQLEHLSLKPTGTCLNVCPWLPSDLCVTCCEGPLGFSVTFSPRSIHSTKAAWLICSVALESECLGLRSRVLSLVRLPLNHLGDLGQTKGPDGRCDQQVQASSPAHGSLHDCTAVSWLWFLYLSGNMTCRTGWQFV